MHAALHLQKLQFYGVCCIYMRGIQKKSDQRSSASYIFPKCSFVARGHPKRFCCCAATLLTDFSWFFFLSRLIRQRGVRAEQMINLVSKLQFPVSLQSQQDYKKECFQKTTEDLFAVVGLEQIQKHPLSVIKTRLKNFHVSKLRELKISFLFYL